MPIHWYKNGFMKMIYMYHTNNPDNKVHGANMGPTRVLSASDRPYVGPMNLVIRERSVVWLVYVIIHCISWFKSSFSLNGIWILVKIFNRNSSTYQDIQGMRFALANKHFNHSWGNIFISAGSKSHFFSFNMRHEKSDIARILWTYICVKICFK